MNRRTVFAGIIGVIVGVGVMIAAVGFGQDADPPPTLESLQARIVKLESQITPALQQPELTKWIQVLDERSEQAMIGVRALSPAYVRLAERVNELEAHDHDPAFPLTLTSSGNSPITFLDLPAGLYDLTITSTADPDLAYELHLGAFDDNGMYLQVHDEAQRARGDRNATVRIHLHDGNRRGWTDRSDDVWDGRAGDFVVFSRLNRIPAGVSWSVSVAPVDDSE